MKSVRPFLVVSLALSLPACHLVDQRDFDAKAGEKPHPPVVAVPAVPPVPALVTIRYTTPDPPYRAALTDAVHKALALKPDVLFTVAARGPDESAAESGREVAQAIVAAGAQPGQIEQVLSIDPSAQTREVAVRVQ